MKTIPVPRSLVKWLLCSIVGIFGFLLVSTIHGLVVPDFAWWHQSVSALALAPYGWIQVINFFALGTAILCTAPAWRRVLRSGKGSYSYPVLTVMLGLSFFMVGCLPQDPAPGYDPAGLVLERPTLTGLLHLAAAGCAALSSIVLMLIVASRLSNDVHWRGWPAYTHLLVGLTITCIVIYGVWSTKSSGLAGLFERFAMLIPAIWGAGFIRRLWLGRPFQQSVPNQDAR